MESGSIHRMNVPASITYDYESAALRPITGCQIIGELVRGSHHCVYFPHSKSFVSSTSSEELLLRVDTASPEFGLLNALKVSVNKSLHFSSSRAVNLYDLRTSRASNKRVSSIVVV